MRSVTFTVSGEHAFGYLKTEEGVHRLVRISPFDSQHRRHTAFASVTVYPELDDSIEIEIEDKDLRVDTYRAGGAGGQHVNKTDSAVRLTHLPTGIVVQCQSERSQHKNRSQAMKVLRARLYERARREQEEKLAALRGDQKEIGFGSQIRSYTLHPAQRVKDHRTGVEIGNAAGVLDGDIDRFIRATLLQRAARRAGAARRTPRVSEQERESRRARLLALRARGCRPVPAAGRRLRADRRGEAPATTRRTPSRWPPSASSWRWPGRVLAAALLREAAVPDPRPGRRVAPGDGPQAARSRPTVFAFAKELDVGDFVRAEGVLWRTQKGELSVDARARSRCSPRACARCPRSGTGCRTSRPATASATSTCS